MRGLSAQDGSRRTGTSSTASAKQPSLLPDNQMGLVQGCPCPSEWARLAPSLCHWAEEMRTVSPQATTAQAQAEELGPGLLWSPEGPCSCPDSVLPWWMDDYCSARDSSSLPKPTSPQPRPGHHAHLPVTSGRGSPLPRGAQMSRLSHLLKVTGKSAWEKMLGGLLPRAGEPCRTRKPGFRGRSKERGSAHWGRGPTLCFCSKHSLL